MAYFFSAKIFHDFFCKKTLIKRVKYSQETSQVALINLNIYVF